MGLVYTGIRVTDLARSLRFYVDGLGLVEKGRGTMSHGGTFVGLEDPGTHVSLELNFYPTGSPFAVPYVAGDGLDHLGVEVDDALATIERLTRFGGTVVLPPWREHDRYWIGFVADPDGNWVEVQSPLPPAAGGPVSAPSAPS